MRVRPPLIFFFFFFNDTPTTEIYPLPLHDALPICHEHQKANEIETFHLSYSRGCAPPASYETGEPQSLGHRGRAAPPRGCRPPPAKRERRSEEHTSELQSRLHLVCRLLLEKKTILFVGMDDGFRVALSTQMMTDLLEFFLQFAVVIDLSIEHNNYTLIIIKDMLLTACHIID